MSSLLSLAEFTATKAKAAALNARAIKRGWTGRTEVAGERRVITNLGNPLPFPLYPAGAQIVRFETTVTGEAPCYGGWRFLAALDATPAADGAVNWIVRCAPGVDDDALNRGQLRQGACDHCETVRPGRRHLYAVQHTDTGELRQVGSTCIKDFLGWSTMTPPPSCGGTSEVSAPQVGRGHVETAIRSETVLLKIVGLGSPLGGI